MVTSCCTGAVNIRVAGRHQSTANILYRAANTLFDLFGHAEGVREGARTARRGRHLDILALLYRFGAQTALALSSCNRDSREQLDEPMPPIDVISTMPPARLADDDRKRKGEGGPGTAVITKTKPQTKRPNLYRVLLLNDDYTPMEFVVHVLERFFNKDHESAHRIMMHVHQHGIGECGIFTYEVAETKVTQVMDFARKHQHPLQCIMEKK